MAGQLIYFTLPKVSLSVTALALGLGGRRGSVWAWNLEEELARFCFAWGAHACLLESRTVCLEARLKPTADLVAASYPEAS